MKKVDGEVLNGSKGSGSFVTIPILLTRLAHNSNLGISYSTRMLLLIQV